MKKIIFFVSLFLCLISCATTKTVEVKDYQIRQYDKFTYNEIVNACIDVMNDLGFVISDFDNENGTISGYTEIYSSFMMININKENNVLTAQAKKIAKSYNYPYIQKETAYNNFFAMLDNKLKEIKK